MNDKFTFTRTSVDSHGVVTHETVLTIPASAIRACPHFIMVPEHYRQSGVCRCTDPRHVEMAGWGYTWNGRRWA